jgi:hypothetical protein
MNGTLKPRGMRKAGKVATWGTTKMCSTFLENLKGRNHYEFLGK